MPGGSLRLHSCSPSRHGPVGPAATVPTRHSGVAQLAEQRTVNPFVVGSSPTPGALDAPALVAGASSRPAAESLRLPSLSPFGAVAQWSERGTHNPLVVGSIPTRPTRRPGRLC